MLEGRAIVRVFLTGRIAVYDDGRTFERFPSRQARLAFAFLVAERDRPATKEELAELLWPGEPPPAWERSLAAIVSKLRTTAPGFTIESAFGCYQLRLPADAWVDVEAAARAIHEAEALMRAGDESVAFVWATVGAEISGRPLLAGNEGAWVDRKRAELRAVRLRSLDCRGSLLVGSGDLGLAIKDFEAAIALEPFHESGHQNLMRAHAAAGNPGEALRAYERCRRILSEELGTRPAPETEAVYLEIMRSTG